MLSIVPSVLLCMLPGAAPCPPDEPVKVMVLVILGSKTDNMVTDKLAEIAAELRKKDPTLKGFILHKTIDHPMKLGETAQFELVPKARLVVTLGEKPDELGRFTLTIKPPKLDEFQYACTCGKFFPVFTNHYTADQRRLIIAVMAKPCKKKK